MTLNNSTVSNNQTSDGAGGEDDGGTGGGIYNRGTLTLNSSSIISNTTGKGVDDQGDGGAGAGLYNYVTGVATVNNSLLANNTTGDGGDNKNGGDGGGLYNRGTVTINNSTLSGNTAADGADGGGIYNTGVVANPGQVTLTNSSVINNKAPTGDGGGLFDTATTGNTAGTMTLKNTLVGGNGAEDAASGPDANGSLASQDHNLIQTTTGYNLTGTTTNNKTGDPKVGPLASNGGNTQTHALLTGSPAIDAGSCAGTSTDQRGFSRPAGNACDIGAYEFGATSNTKVYLPLVIKSTATTTTPDTPSSDFVNRVVTETNKNRTQNGCPALTLNTQLTQAAQSHTQDMAVNDYFDHTAPNGSTPSQRIAATGYQASADAENIAAGKSTPEATVTQWMNSTGHRANILNCNYTEIGVGYYFLENDTGANNYNHYWTQVFARPAN